ALIVKGTSRIHTKLSSGPSFNPNAPPVAGLDVDRPGHVVIGPKKDDPFKKIVVAGNKDEREDPKKDPKDPNKPKFDPTLDPKVIWQDALARAPAEPGLIIAVSDFLAILQKWDHAAEFLKANLRQGYVVKPWVYEALALALRESKASPDEI